MNLRVRAIIIIGVLLMIVPCISEAKIVSVSAGSGHVLALDDDGSVWAWGYNVHGELGNGQTSLVENTPKKVPIDDVTAVSASGFSMALKLDGTVWAWGEGDLGSLGTGGTENHMVPVQVSNLTGIVAIAAGSMTGYALKNDGTVWAWGHNDIGQVGDGTNVTRLSPVQVQGLTDIKALGERGRYAIKSDGTVYAWGDTFWTNLTPRQVSGISGVRMITNAEDYVLAAKSDGSVWGWCNHPYLNFIGNANFSTLGTNDKGELGDGTIAFSLTPVQAKVSGIKYVSTTDHHSVALKDDGTVWEWGRRIDGTSYDKDPNAGQPDKIDNSHDAMPDPRQVNNLSDIVAVSAGVGYCVALDEDGTVWGWGTNNGFCPLGFNKGTGYQGTWVTDPVKLFKSTESGTPLITHPAIAVDTLVPSIVSPTPSPPAVTPSSTAGQDSKPAPGMGFATALSAIAMVTMIYLAFGVMRRKN